jgi:hypothetical protein
MWESRPLAPLWAFTASYRDSFTYFTYFTYFTLFNDPVNNSDYIVSNYLDDEEQRIDTYGKNGQGLNEKLLSYLNEDYGSWLI